MLIRFNDAAPGRRPNGRYVVAEVRDWLRREAAALAERFDRRNGTAYYAEQLLERGEWQAFAQPPE